LREHLPYIDGFMPKGIMQRQEDEKYFVGTKQYQQTKVNATQARLW